MPDHDISFGYQPGQEIGYDQITGGVTVTSTTEASPTTVIACAAHSFDGGAVILTVFFAYLETVSNAADDGFITLFEGATQITRLILVDSPSSVSNNDRSQTAQYRFTPTAGLHTYTIGGHKSGGTFVIGAGAAGTGHYPPSFVRFTKV